MQLTSGVGSCFQTLQSISTVGNEAYVDGKIL